LGVPTRSIQTPASIGTQSLHHEKVTAHGGSLLVRLEEKTKRQEKLHVPIFHTYNHYQIIYKYCFKYETYATQKPHVNT